jgi:hypothetical protein
MQCAFCEAENYLKSGSETYSTQGELPGGVVELETVFFDSPKFVFRHSYPLNTE